MLFYIGSRKIKGVLKNICIFLFVIFLITWASSTSILWSKDDSEIIVWWTALISGPDRLIHSISGGSCLISNNKSLLTTSNVSAVIFYGSSFNLEDLPLPKKIPWAIYHEESPKNLALFMYKEAQDIFDYTSTISTNSDLPVTLQYLKTADVLLTDRFYISIEEKNRRLKKLAPVLYLQSDCDTPSNRNAFVEQLSLFINIDSYGTCLNNKTIPVNLMISNNLIDYYNDELMHFISQYKFVIAIENAQCYDYISEKFWRSLIVGSVPIYKGAPNIKDWFPNNLSAILVDDFLSAKELADYLHVLNENDEMYMKYLALKIEKTIENVLLKGFLNRGSYGLANNHDGDHPVYLFERLICDSVYRKIYRKNSRKNVFDCLEPINPLWKSHWTNGKQNAETLKHLISFK